MPATISEVELTAEDAKKLRHKLMAIAMFFVISIVIVVVIFLNANFTGFDEASYVFGAFGLFFFGIIIYMGWGFAADLFRGQKLVIRGIVTDKRRHKSSSSRGTRGGGRRGGRRGSSSSSSPRYYLFFEDKKYYVDLKHYNQAHVGQEIELHYAPKSSSSLSVTALSEVDSTPTEEYGSVKAYLESRKAQIRDLPKKETVMSSGDLLLLRKYRNRVIRRNLGYTVFFGFIAVAFTVGGLLWWVMYIPAVLLWLGVIGLLKGIMAARTKFRKDELGAMKLVVLTKIVDKQNFTGSSKGYRVVTEYGSYSVTPELYQGLKGQQPVFVSVGKHSGWLIDIITKGGD